jgi:hypothetical protein
MDKRIKHRTPKTPSNWGEPVVSWRGSLHQSAVNDAQMAGLVGMYDESIESLKTLPVALRNRAYKCLDLAFSNQMSALIDERFRCKEQLNGAIADLRNQIHHESSPKRGLIP